MNQFFFSGHSPKLNVVSVMQFHDPAADAPRLNIGGAIAISPELRAALAKEAAADIRAYCREALPGSLPPTGLFNAAPVRPALTRPEADPDEGYDDFERGYRAAARE